jgi:hypothetical protein
MSNSPEPPSNPPEAPAASRAEVSFYLLVALSIFAIWCSHPFMRYPYDVWGHLANIYDIQSGQISLPFRKGWYVMWGWIFHQFSIDDIFARAEVIHVTQILVSVSAVFYFSYVSIGSLFITIPKTTLKYLSFWATLIWLTIFGTFSMYYQQVWVLWYSVNYQIALALFWYCAALAFALAFRYTTARFKIVATIQICLLSVAMMELHPMELGYFVMYVFALCLVFIDRIAIFCRSKWRSVVPVMLGTPATSYLLVTYVYRDKVPDLLYYLQRGEMKTIWDLIIKNGATSVSGLNRASASINELMYVTLGSSILLAVLLSVRLLLKKPLHIRPRMLLALTVTSLFVLIPLFTFSAGLATIIFMLGVENRIYYSSALFVVLPVVVYYMLQTRGTPVRIATLNCCLAAVMSLTLTYSYYFSTSHTYFKNAASLLASWDNKKVGFHLSPENLAQIRARLETYEEQAAQQGKPPLYFARGDIAFMLKYAFGREVFLREHRHSPTLEEFHEFLTLNNRRDAYLPIIFETPPSFPEYRPFS